MKKLSAFFILISAICMLSGCTEQTAAQINNEPVQIQQPVKAPGAERRADFSLPNIKVLFIGLQ